MTNQTRSRIFTTYNHVKAAMPADDRSSRGRADRALGLAQTGEKRPYVTTLWGCTCPDSRFRGGVCKHRLALVLRGDDDAAA